MREYDLIIVGAGPAGCACAYSLRNSNLDIGLFDQSEFPRDKICGDALSADVVNQLYRIDEELGKRFTDFTEKLPSNGVRFFAPNGNSLDIPFINSGQANHSAGYISKRLDFDNFWFEQVNDLPNVDIYTGSKIKEVSQIDDRVKVLSDRGEFRSKMIIGADGAHSIINKSLGQIQVEKNHYCAGIRRYYEGVNGFHEGNHIELHFYKEALPGYLWIFPLPNGLANVGIGMLSSEVSRKKVNLKTLLDDLIGTHPNLKDRFSNATHLENHKGFGLPIGSKKRPISGERFLLLGDAASLVDPFSGEGIANAIRSGRLAADHIEKAFVQQDFSAKFNKKYDKIVYEKMWSELRVSRSMQKLLRYPRLFNYVVKKANRNESVRLLLTSMLDNVDIKKELTKISFYVKLFFS